MTVVLGLYMFMGLAGNAMHTSYHFRNFHLEQYEWYLELRSLHWLHHRGAEQGRFANLGMCNVKGIDSYFRSYYTTDVWKHADDPKLKNGEADGPIQQSPLTFTIR